MTPSLINTRWRLRMSPFDVDLSAGIFAEGAKRIQRYEAGSFWQVLRYDERLQSKRKKGGVYSRSLGTHRQRFWPGVHEVFERWQSDNWGAMQDKGCRFLDGIGGHDQRHVEVWCNLADDLGLRGCISNYYYDNRMITGKRLGRWPSFGGAGVELASSYLITAERLEITVWSQAKASQYPQFIYFRGFRIIHWNAYILYIDF